MREKLYSIFCLFLLLFCVEGSLSAQCDSTTQIKLTLQIDPDQYEEEISWRVTNLGGNIVYYTSNQLTSNNLQTFNYCLPISDECYKFTILDSYGDGMHYQDGPYGSYKLFLNGVLLFDNPTGEYNYSESTVFNCSEGHYCETAFPTALGAQVAPFSQSWFEFTPVDTGIYEVLTCNNNCPTKVWVYDHCDGLLIDDGNLGTIAYAEDGCTNGLATASMYLAGGKSYYIRIGYIASNCIDSTINFELAYVGPISGCTDPSSCNYSPLATINDGSCIPFGDPNCTGYIDLEVNVDLLKTSLEFDQMTNNDACYVQEGCIRGYGQRNLVRFGTQIFNKGNTDYNIGYTPDNSTDTSTQFVWDPCHGHWHYRGYAEYVLFDANGVRIPIGSKNGFCVLDLNCPPGLQAKYTCSNMGITAGCSDTYGAYLPCQWVDMTGLAPGSYQLAVLVNWDKSPDQLGRYESDYLNNWGQVCFNYTLQNGQYNVDVIDDCPAYTDCMGELYGPAQPDCEGVCAGTRLRGDIDLDTMRTDIDFDWYINETLTSNLPSTNCNDLYSDSKVSLYDAALLQECITHADDIPYWGSHIPCTFPKGLVNESDKPFIRMGAINTTDKTLDIEIAAPANKLFGLDLQFSGMLIDSVVNLSAGYNPSIHFNNTNGKVIMWAEDESSIAKSTSYKPLMRIYYNQATSDTICLSAINEIINDKYELTDPILIGNPCKLSTTSSSDDLSLNAGIIVYPNPFQETISILLPESFTGRTDFKLYSADGRLVHQRYSLNENQVKLHRNDLPTGVYHLQVRNASVTATIKVEIN